MLFIDIFTRYAKMPPFLSLTLHAAGRYRAAEEARASARHELPLHAVAHGPGHDIIYMTCAVISVSPNIMPPRREMITRHVAFNTYRRNDDGQ